MTAPNLNTLHVTGTITDISTASAAYIYVTEDMEGELVDVAGVLAGAISGADATITVSINGTSVGTITVANASSAEGDVDSVSLSGKAVVAGDYIKIATDGGSTNTVSWSYTARIQR